MKLIKNPVLNGLINYNYGYIVYRFEKEIGLNDYNWLALYDIDKRKKQLFENAESWEEPSIKCLSPHLFHEIVCHVLSPLLRRRHALQVSHPRQSQSVKHHLR